MAYKNAAKLDQSRLRRPIGDHLPSYFEDLSDEQKRECLKSVVLGIEEEIQIERDKWRRKALGIRKAELCLMMNKLRPKKKSPGATEFFVQAARETLTADLFRMILHKASLMNEQNQK